MLIKQSLSTKNMFKLIGAIKTLSRSSFPYIGHSKQGDKLYRDKLVTPFQFLIVFWIFAGKTT